MPVTSLQGDLMAILETAVQDGGRLSPDEILSETKRIGLATPRDAAAMIRADRGW